MQDAKCKKDADGEGQNHGRARLLVGGAGVVNFCHVVNVIILIACSFEKMSSEIELGSILLFLHQRLQFF